MPQHHIQGTGVLEIRLELSRLLMEPLQLGKVACQTARTAHKPHPAILCASTTSSSTTTLPHRQRSNSSSPCGRILRPASEQIIDNSVPRAIPATHLSTLHYHPKSRAHANHPVLPSVKQATHQPSRQCCPPGTSPATHLCHPRAPTHQL